MKLEIENAKWIVYVSVGSHVLSLDFCVVCLFTIHYSLDIIHFSVFMIYYSLFTILDSLYPLFTRDYQDSHR